MDNERVLYTACPLCESADIQAFGQADCTNYGGWREPLKPFIIWMQCNACQHVFAEGYFNDEALSVLFGADHGELTVGVDIEAQRVISAQMIRQVVDVIGLPDDRLWLDVGFGNGSLLMTAKEFGFEVFGVDLRKRNVEDIAQFGIAGHYGTLESARNQVAFAQRPTVISMADVVEHEPFPLDCLRTARELIQDSGVLFISMPNASAPLWHHWNATRDNPYWAVMEHYHNFTRERLYWALEQTGFKAIHYAISDRYRCGMEVLARAV